VASLIGNARVIINEQNMFIIQAVGQFETFSNFFWCQFQNSLGLVFLPTEGQLDQADHFEAYFGKNVIVHFFKFSFCKVYSCPKERPLQSDYLIPFLICSNIHLKLFLASFYHEKPDWINLIVTLPFLSFLLSSFLFKKQTLYN
jgi:hypothetical protein